MSFDLAVRLVEVGLSIAILQRSGEHLRREPWLSSTQILLALALLLSVWPLAVVAGLWVLGLIQLHHFNGAYNGGADKMVLLGLTSLVGVHLSFDAFLGEVFFAYLAVQVVLSYFVSGWVKFRNPAWRSGTALTDVFAYSVYPAAENFRGLAKHPSWMVGLSWAVILFEILFPLALLHQMALVAALILAAAFHLSNAILLGLNRFFWAWIAVFPSVIWLQARVF